MKTFYQSLSHIFILNNLKNTYSPSQKIMLVFIFSIISITKVSICYSQKDTTGNVIINNNLPSGCSIIGSTAVVGGSIINYALNCEAGEVADYWEITCGTVTDGHGTEALIQWDATSCTRGTIKAMKFNGTILASKNVTITLTPPPSIAYTPLYNSSNFTKTIDILKPVGSVAGAAGTEASGSTTYSIPIYTPPGTNGLEPAISVSYNSQASSGIAGWGWNISGLSLISRTGKNMYHNGIVNPVTYTATDAFLLDGMRLNVITGLNGDNGTVYAGEMESFSKITSITNSSPNNPDWFKVVAKDGSIMEFGNTVDSRVLTDDRLNVMLWRLNRILDISGNYIDFVYDNTGRDSRIKTIKYTGNTNTGLAPYNSLAFGYKLRLDKNTGYDAGATLSSQYLLDKITVLTNNNSITKNYLFNYGFDNINSFLKEVTEASGDGTTLNATTFLYGDQPQNILSTSTVALTGEYDFFAGDFDADGKTDLLAAKSYLDVTVQTRLHSEYSLINDVNQTGYGLLYAKMLPQNASSEIVTDKKFFSFLNSDFNGDGRDDVININAVNENVNCYYYQRRVTGATISYTKSFNTQTGFTDYLEQNIDIPNASGFQFNYVSSTGNYFLPGDFDGDGNQDFILLLGKKRQINTCGTSLTPNYAFDYKAFITSPGTNEINIEIGNFGFGANSDPSFYAGTIAGADMINVFDFDGDGKMEILVTKDGTSYVFSMQKVSIASGYSFIATVIFSTSAIIKNNKIFPGDFNGDKKIDFLVRNNDATWKILYSTGTSFSAASFTFNQPVIFTGIYGDHLLLVSDFNGDGKSDILHGYPVNGSSANQSKFSLYYSEGLLSATLFYNEQYTYNNILALGTYGSSNGIVIGDFNGDGRTDLLNRYNINAPADFVSFKPFGKEKLLVKVTDGYNATTSFAYKLLTDKSTYPYFYDRTISLDDPDNKNPYNYIQLPLYALSAVTVPDGIGGNNITSYNYENAVVHRAAKGFLGFKKITTKNLIADIVSITENDINAAFAVPYTVKQTTKLISTGELLSESQITTSFVNISTGFTDKRYVQKIDKTLAIDYLNGRASETINTYDAFNNITQSVAKTGIPSGTTVAATEILTTTANYSVHNTPVAAKPDNVTVSNLRTGQPALSSTTTFIYTNAGLPAAQTVFSGLPKAVTTTYTYNGFGNPLTVTTSSTGLNDRSITNTYDAKGIFALTKQVSSNDISHTESYTYDEQWGQPVTHTSTDCLTTTFEYDLFGRLKKSTLPQGYSVTNSLNWDISGNNIWYSFMDYPGGRPDCATWYDKLGRETKSQSVGFNNKTLTKQVAYNAKGQLSAQTNDYYAAETPLITSSTYDLYGRLITAANTLNTITNTYTVLGGGRLHVVTSNASGQSSSKITDATGKVVTAIDNGGQLDFTFDSRGNQLQVQHGSNVLITSVYDNYGRQTSLLDKNAGAVTYNYNAFGQLTQQTDAKSNTYNMLYDGLGRLTNRTGPEGATNYEYYSVAGCSNNSLVKITGFNGVTKEYTYDVYKRVASEKVTIDGIPLTTSFMYDQYNALTKTVYPSGIEENRTYNNNGGLLTVGGSFAGVSTNLCTVTGVNGFGQATSFTLGNGKATQHSYTLGIPTRYYTPGVQDLNMVFDYTKGNLLTRWDANKNITENFTYDNLNRLTSATVNNLQQFAISYDGNAILSMGNIISKTDAGNYVYKTDKVHAVAYITNPAGAQTPPANIAVTEQQITYTGFLKTASISDGLNTLNFTYGPDYERVKTILKNNGVLQETRAYVGNYEIQISADGILRELHYIGGADGLCALIVKQGTTITPYFIYTDHLGSLVTITDAAGAVVAEQNFDAWGRKRNPVNWQYGGVTDLPILNRGFTGHEHLPQFALINMNGRMYDPVQGRMLSPDNYLATPFGTQGYNRYSYANNNPLIYVDPDGNNPIIIAALIGGFLKGMQYGNQGKSFLSGFWRGAAIGAAGSYAGTFAPIGILPGLAYGTGTGALLGGIGAGLDGGNIWNGALKGGLTGGALGAISGGIEASNLGANIWTGYRQNHYTLLSDILESGVSGSTAAPFNDEYLNKLYNLNYPNTPGMNYMSMKWMPKETKINADGSWITTDGSNVAAITVSRVWRHGLGDNSIYFSGYAFASKERLAFLMAHELGHVTHNYLGLSAFANEGQGHPDPLLNNEGHRAIQYMTHGLAYLNGWNVNKYGLSQSSDFLNYSLSSDRLYSPLLFLIKKIVFPK